AYELYLRENNMLPDLHAQDPDLSRNMRIQPLAPGIHNLIRQHELPRMMLQAFAPLPEMKWTPHQMIHHQEQRNVETVAISQLG
ncbi:lysine decarboxylase LdcC, partial [Erwinia amylovora]|nr:lysine decarboxylase LdcC [Erwinia amylovora]